MGSRSRVGRGFDGRPSVLVSGGPGERLRSVRAVFHVKH